MITNKDSTVSIILPIFNEGSHLFESVRTIRKAILKADEAIEILLIDDGSSDDSWDIASKLVGDGTVSVALKLSRNFGKEAAVRAGLERCSGASAIIMDSDLQHPPEAALKMIEKWRDQSFQIVEAVKIDRTRDHLTQRFFSSLFYKTYRTLTGVNLKGASDFKLLDRVVIDSLIKLPETHQFLRGITRWMEFDTAQVPFEVQERAGGTSGWSGRKLLSYGVNSILSFSQKPLYIVSIGTSIILITFSLILSLRALIVWALGSPPSGTTTIILALSFFSALISINQTIANIYVGRVFEQVKKRPIYLISHELSDIDAN